MQDKETVVEDAEEALTFKTDVISDTPESKKNNLPDRKEPTKDGKFAFRKMKTPKKEKSEKSSVCKYEGDGAVFKAKLIGIEAVPEPRGDKMCQEAMQRLKLNVKSSGPHKRKITIGVTLQGIKIKDEKTGTELHHHPVSFISFICQDITDARAFGYVFGSTSEPHQFIAIKTEKPAFHVVLALRDLFQTVLDRKQQAIANVKEQQNDVTKTETTSVPLRKESKTENELGEISKIEENLRPENENIYFEVLMTEPVQIPEDAFLESKEPTATVDDLLGLQSEMNKLQEGIYQMDFSIAAAAAFTSEIPVPENDPFDTSFVLGRKRDSFPLPIPTPISIPAPVSETFQQVDTSGDKYAAFNVIDSGPSIFEVETAAGQDGAHTITELKELEDLEKKPVPPKPPRQSKPALPDLSVFAELDPLGKDRPYVDKTEFFQDVKNPPKKVLNDLVDPSKEKAYDTSVLCSPNPFPVDFESVSSSSVPASSPPNHLPAKLSLPLAYQMNGDGRSRVELTNGFDTRHSAINGSNYPGSQQPLTVNTSSPIPIPTSQRPFSNGSIGSPYSKSPNLDSPVSSDYYIPCYGSEGDSPTGIQNGINLNGNVVSNNLTRQNLNSHLNSTNPKPSTNAVQNGVSRPRPRPSSNRSGSIANVGRAVSSHSLSSDSSSDYEAISRENMQSITNMLMTNGHRIRAQSLCLESNNDFKLKVPGEKNIFAKKHDPFADDFFYALPKKNGLCSNGEIPEYV